MACVEWINAWISTHANITDLLTKPMASGEKRNGFVKQVLEHIFRKEQVSTRRRRGPCFLLVSVSRASDASWSWRVLPGET